MRFGFWPLAAAFAIATLPSAASAQRPTRLREPRGFEFSRDGVWRRRARTVRAARQAALARGDLRALNAPLAQRAQLMAAPGAPRPAAMAVGGTLYAPAFLVKYKNTSADPFPASQYTDVLFGATAPAGRPYSLRTFYEEMSDSMFSVQGQVVGWTTLDSNDTWYEGSCNGDVICSGGGHVPQLILEAVQKNDAAVDYGQFDNDGADGLPNSGDDDGLVDVAFLIHPEVGAECQALVPSSVSNIWSHRFSYSGWGFLPITTNDPGAGGGFIRVNDYIIQPAVGGATSCEGNEIMPIGTVAHELGHGLELPDFYDTNPDDGDDSEGIGAWGLMSSGNYDRPLSPAYMEGFSRLQLGWVTLVNLTADGTYTLGAYPTADTIVRVTPIGPNPRGEYFLIENRQGVLSDSALVARRGAGMLVFHVDQQQYQAGLGFNVVNSGPIHGLWLLQADGLNQLRSSVDGIRNRGDAGDPYPGTSFNATLHYSSSPNNRLNVSGAFSGFYIDSIGQVTPGGAMAFRLVFPAALAAADTVLRPGVMGAPYADTLRVSGGTGSFQFALAGGSLPPGITLTAGGVLSGIPTTVTTATFTVGVTSGPQGVTLPLRLVVTAPQLAAQTVADQLLLGGSALTADEQRYMDLAGNNNARFDIGDVVAWADRNPSAPLAELLRRLAGRPR